MKQFIIQCVACIILGSTVFGLSKLLRCKVTDAGISEPRRSALDAVAAVAISMSILFLLMLPQILAAKAPTSTHNSHQAFALAPQILILALYAGPAGIFMFRNRESLRSAGISRINLWQSLVIGTGLPALMICLNHGGSHAKLPLPTLAHALIFYSFVGFGEEFLFRGYLQTRLVAWLGIGRGWILASLLMALAHFPGRLILGMGFFDSFVSSLSLVPASFLSGFIMLQIRNLLAPGLIHTFMDWVNVL